MMSFWFCLFFIKNILVAVKDRAPRKRSEVTGLLVGEVRRGSNSRIYSQLYSAFPRPHLRPLLKLFACLKYPLYSPPCPKRTHA